MKSEGDPPVSFRFKRVGCEPACGLPSCLLPLRLYKIRNTTTAQSRRRTKTYTIAEEGEEKKSKAGDADEEESPLPINCVVPPTNEVVVILGEIAMGVARALVV